MKLFILIMAAATSWSAGASGTTTIESWELQSVPPVAWATADPADSLYRAARRALNSREYGRAAELFDSIVRRYPKSEYAPDALYWKGFALYRDGSLENAASALDEQEKKYRNAPTRGDARALLIRIQGDLARRGNAKAGEAVDSAARAGSGACGDMEVRAAALDALQQMDPDRALPLLRKVLARNDACSKGLRRNALFILAQKSGAQREALLLDVAKNDSDKDVRSEAVFHLSQARSDEAVTALEDLLKNSPDRAVRSNALFALAQNRAPRAKGILRGFALDASVPMNLRNDAIFHLAQDRDEESREWIRGAYATIVEKDLRNNVLFHIASHGGDETAKWLTGVVVDPKESMELRNNALFHLANTRSRSSAELASVYERVPGELKNNVLFHLSSRRDAAALDKLIAVAKTDRDPEMRKTALFHIAQSKDPRAFKALEEIVTP